MIMVVFSILVPYRLLSKFEQYAPVVFINDSEPLVSHLPAHGLLIKVYIQ